jgi:hypothetical protein
VRAFCAHAAVEAKSEKKFDKECKREKGAEDTSGYGTMTGSREHFCIISLQIERQSTSWSCLHLEDERYTYLDVQHSVGAYDFFSA